MKQSFDAGYTYTLTGENPEEVIKTSHLDRFLGDIPSTEKEADKAVESEKAQGRKIFKVTVTYEEVK
jgi:hypothetical protein